MSRGARGVRERSYRDLVAWQKAMVLVKDVHRITQGWPEQERYGLTSQVRRAAVSVPSNIAEGQGRTGTKELLHHLSIAHGSLYEVETHLLIAQQLEYIDDPACHTPMAQTEEVGRLLGGLIRSLRPPAGTN